MKFYKDAIFQFGNGQGCSLIAFTEVKKPKRIIYAGGSRGGESRQVVQNKNEPWEAQKEFLKTGFGEAKKLYDTGTPNLFPGQTYAATSPQSESALQGAEARARAGSPLTRGAQTSLQDYFRPDFLTNNPAYNAALSANLGDILPQIQGQFAGGGRFNSGLARAAEQAAASKEAGRLMMPLMQEQRAAMAMAPGLAHQDYFDLSKLAEVGTEREGINQQSINEAMMRHEQTKNFPQQNLDAYLNRIQGNYGGTSTESRPVYGRNRFGSALGGGLSGAAAGASLGGPWGAGIGGVAGLLSGLF